MGASPVQAALAATPQGAWQYSTHARTHLWAVLRQAGGQVLGCHVQQLVGSELLQGKAVEHHSHGLRGGGAGQGQGQEGGGRGRGRGKREGGGQPAAVFENGRSVLCL